MWVVSGVTLQTRWVSPPTIAHGASGRIERPAFPAPSYGRARKFLANLGRLTPRDRESVSHSSLRGALATKQSILAFFVLCRSMHCFASSGPRFRHPSGFNEPAFCRFLSSSPFY